MNWLNNAMLIWKMRASWATKWAFLLNRIYFYGHFSLPRLSLQQIECDINNKNEISFYDYRQLFSCFIALFDVPRNLHCLTCRLHCCRSVSVGSSKDPNDFKPYNCSSSVLWLKLACCGNKLGRRRKLWQQKKGKMISKI